MCAQATNQFASILSLQVRDQPPAQRADSLHDVALDLSFAQIGASAPRASSAFLVPLLTVAEVEYRQDVFRALEAEQLRDAVEHFLRGMSACEQRDRAASKANYPYEAALCHLGAIGEYARAVAAFCTDLADALARVDTPSEGVDLLSRHVTTYRSSAGFHALESEASELQDHVAHLRYNALIRGPKVTIAHTDDEGDLGEAVLSTFERFWSGDGADHRTTFRSAELDHVQVAC